MPARVAEPVEAHGPTGRAERGERGATRIADRVIAKIAARAARSDLGRDGFDAWPRDVSGHDGDTLP
ncbi:hypothetical protein ACWD6I_11400, partial [Streptomyces sp. NPDC002454]